MRRRTAAFRCLIGLFAAASLAACDSTAPILPGSLSPTLGDQQIAVAGTAVATLPTVAVKDTKGRAMKGANVTFTVSAGGGSVEGGSVVSGADGTASPASWTLGTTAGVNTLTARVDGVQTPITFTAIGRAGAPASVTATSGNGQRLQVGQTVSVLPTVLVKDAHENAVEGATVTFAVTSGGGSVSGETVATDAQGYAHVGGWRIGNTMGANTISASVAGAAPAIFLANGFAGPASSIGLNTNPKPTQVGTAVAQPPVVVVRDVFQNPVAGVSVTFTVSVGNGTLSGATQTSDSSGLAKLGGWTLGPAAGTQSLIASATGVGQLPIDITALPGAAAQLAINVGNNQSALAGTAVATPPSVVVRDRFGNAVGLTNVIFAVASGGGSVTGASVFSNASGIATVGSWQLGSAVGVNTLTATASGLPPVTFTANATSAPVVPPLPPTDPAGYNITVRYVVTPTARQQLAVERAVARWQRVITADLPDVPANVPAGACGSSSAINGTIDDIIIFVDFSPIDGAGKILGQGGPCFIRSDSHLPVIGALELDAADLATMESDGRIDDVVLHEFGHILGIGTLWTDKGLLANPVTDSVTFTGPKAGDAFTNSGGVIFPGKPVPVENCVGIAGCGSGTRDSHWRELVMGRELMTGYIGVGGSNPLSRITIQSLADLGYTVDVTAADSYTVGMSLRAGEEPPIELREGKRSWTIRTLPSSPNR